MSKVVKHSKRYIVQWWCLDEWVDDGSYNSLRRASKKARDLENLISYPARVIDTAEEGSPGGGVLERIQDWWERWTK